MPYLKDHESLAEVVHAFGQVCWPIPPAADERARSVLEKARESAAEYGLELLGQYLKQGRLRAVNMHTGLVHDPSVTLSREATAMLMLPPSEIEPAVKLLLGDWGTPVTAPEQVNPPLKAVPRLLAQESEILSKLVELGFDPKAMPRAEPGKPSPSKQKVRDALPHTRAVFKKAWQRLRNDGRIKDA